MLSIKVQARCADSCSILVISSSFEDCRLSLCLQRPLSLRVLADDKVAAQHGACKSGVPVPGPWKPYNTNYRKTHWKQPCHQKPACATDLPIAMHVHLLLQKHTHTSQHAVHIRLAMYKNAV